MNSIFFKSLFLLSLTLAIAGCNTASKSTSRQNYEGAYKDLNQVGIIADANSLENNFKNQKIFIRFDSARLYGEDGKTQRGGSLGTPGLGFPEGYIELLPGKYNLRIFCMAGRSGSATLHRDFEVIAGKTTTISCEPVPENNFNVYIKLHSIIDTDVNFKRYSSNN